MEVEERIQNPEKNTTHLSLRVQIWIKEQKHTICLPKKKTKNSESLVDLSKPAEDELRDREEQPCKAKKNNGDQILREPSNRFPLDLNT